MAAASGLSKDSWKVPRLVVWDVNDVIVMGSIDDAVFNLLPPEHKQSLNISHKGQSLDNATLMTNVMKTLHDFHIGRWAIESLIRTLPVHRLMVDAVREMYRERIVQVIISHSNVPFIHTLLKHYGILDHFSVIFANEGEWLSNDCDSPMEVRPMHKDLDKEGNSCTCNWQQTGICRRLALHSILRYLKLDAWTAVMHANWGLCVVEELKKSQGMLLSRIGSKQMKARLLDFPGADQTLEKELSSIPQVRYQHGEDLINILRQPIKDPNRSTGLLTAGRREVEGSFLSNASHYFDDTRLCSTPDRRMCRKYPN